MNEASNILVLQGPLGRFYGQIAESLIAKGNTVYRVNFSGNDLADWPHEKPLNFSGTLSEFDVFLTEELGDCGIQAILLHGDRRPYHKVAIAWARARCISVFVTELGYTRPDWTVLEREGTGALSLFPSDPTAIRTIAETCPDVDFTPKWKSKVWPLILGEIRFTFFNAFWKSHFPNYQSHRNQPPHKVYMGWLASRFNFLALKRPTVPPAKSFVFALQLEGDFQLRDHSPFSSVEETVEFVANSFAKFGDPDDVLVLKPHPHEFGLKNLLNCVSRLRRQLNLNERMVVIEDQSIRDLCNNASGFVTINSSAGFEALDVGCPVHTVMPTIYDVVGLTHQGTLNDFWTKGRSPDAGLFEDLRKSLASTVQVRGTIYHPEARKAAAITIAKRLTSSDKDTQFPSDKMPPRLDKAATMGVVYE